jgi:hypothetical protein
VPTQRELLEQISAAARQPSFEPLLRRWQILYGSAAAGPLFKVARAQDAPERPESIRYVALMGAARLGGRPAAAEVSAFLQDRSWMLRTGALRALMALQDPRTAPRILPLLHDPSLAVRLEAVTAAAHLKPAGAADALLRELASSDNYHAGKALWVPGRALSALSALRASETAPRLAPLLDHENDPDLQLETVATLERLTGRILMPGAPLPIRVREWKLALAK